MSLPDLQAGIDRLSNITGKDLKPVMDNYVPAKELAQRAASSEKISALDTIAQVRDDLQNKFPEGSERVSNLLSVYHINRDKQMETLSKLGKDVLLSLMAQGVLGASIAQELQVSHDTYHEFVRLTCTPEEIKHAEMLAADALVAQGVEEIHAAEDKEDLAKAKAIAEINLKLAKAFTNKYAEKKMPSTAVQVNTYNNSTGEDSGPVPYLQMIVPDRDNLPELKKHTFTTESLVTATPELEGITEGEFTLYEGED